MPEKRGSEEAAASASGENASNGSRERKRSRFGAPVNAVPVANESKVPPGDGGTAKLSVPKLDVLEKAKKALKLQKELQAKLKNLPAQKPAASAAPAAAAPVPATIPPPPAAAAAALAAAARGTAPAAAPLPVGTASKPAPLILDESGREIGPDGKPIERHIKPVSTFKVNLADRKPAAAPEKEQPQTADEDVGFDPRMGSKGLRRMERKRRSFKFVAEGVFQRQAELARVRAKYGDKAFRQMQERQERERREAKQAANLNIDANAMPLGERAQPKKRKPPVPNGLLQGGTYGAVADEGVGVQEGKLTMCGASGAHRAPDRGADAGAAAAELTKVELKKLRTQRRRQREMEKQELIRQGLLEPAKPKVKISNLMRVLGSEATADPTVIEKEVRAQMEERQMAHEDRNLARKLTPAERREKKVKKLFGNPDEVAATQVAVYRIEDLSFKQHIYKVDINAQENRLTGIAITVEDSFSLVIVEGSAKAIKRYNKLMLRRIDWNPVRDEDDAPEQRPVNSCNLVWQGEVQNPAFEKFTKEVCSTTASAKKILDALNVGHYWDLAENWQPEVGV
eukprot:CAMPEP_0177583822 /NCGR_PEP_ID=MMETSP0419_2-20121207/3541_1 /TAXON_ID=582737 /ORGANISM="Tetraselmis sp., Strain GSL018" /LENGTH=568 /DNA_ID=CAMNT_0019073267 /DNA_START=670 /DNA_END=2378 /DNA_ORIENTATION=-